MLQLEQVTKRYLRNEQSFAAVDRVSLHLEEGDFVHIVGRSGSGKTTLLSLVAGLLHPDEGKISLAGETFSALDEEARARFRNRHIGVIPQHSTLLSSLTVLDNVVLPRFLYEKEGDIYGRALYLLEKLGVRELEKAYPKTLSGGEQRRVLIARALMNEPELLLADEPTSDLDPESTETVMQLLQGLNEEGMTLLVVTHELDTLRYGKRVLRMDRGQLREESR